MGGTGSKREDHIITAAHGEEDRRKFTYIPYKSGGEAATQLVGKHIDSNVNNPSENIAQWRAGQVRALCVFDSERMPYKTKVTADQSWEDIPTCKETGLDVEVPDAARIFLPGQRHRGPGRLLRGPVQEDRRRRPSTRNMWRQQRAQAETSSPADLRSSSRRTSTLQQELMTEARFSRSRQAGRRLRELAAARPFRREQPCAAEDRQRMRRASSSRSARAARLVDNWQLGAGWGRDGPNRATFPFGLAVLMCVFSAIGIVENLRARARTRPSSRASSWPRARVFLPVVVFVRSDAVPRDLRRERRPDRRASCASSAGCAGGVSLAVGVGVTVALFGIFEIEFLVPLPKGPLEDVPSGSEGGRWTLSALAPPRLRGADHLAATSR